MAEEKAKYRCTEQELYAISGLGINNLETDLLKFTAKSTNYNPAFIITLRGLVTIATALPDEEQRNGIHQNLKNQLPGLLDPIVQDFKDLQNYIKDGWPTEDPKARYEQAGLVNYNKIGTSNWEYVKGLNKNMSDFVADAGNLAKLTTPGGMIATFVTDMGHHYDAFKSVYDAFLSSRETSTARAEKIKANNNLFTAVMKFMTFGVESVFRGDDANMKRYTWTVLKDIVSPPGSASLTVNGKKADDNVVTDAVVTIKKDGEPALVKNITVDTPAYFQNINPGDYAGTIDVGGVKTGFFKTVNTGTNARITVEVA